MLKERFWSLARFAFIMGLHRSAEAYIAVKPFSGSFERAQLRQSGFEEHGCAATRRATISMLVMPLRLNCPLNEMN